MKTTIWRNGVLSIKPENSLEAYALSKWCEDNKDIFKKHPIAMSTIVDE